MLGIKLGEMLSFVQFGFDSYQTDLILFVFSFFICLTLVQYLFRATPGTGLVRASHKSHQMTATNLSKTYNSRQNPTPPPSPEPESEPTDGTGVKNWLEDSNCMWLSAATQNADPEPEESLALPEISHELSPPKVLRWSYDAHVEDQKQNQRKGTFSPLAALLRPEDQIKLPPGLDHPGFPPWNGISCEFSKLKASALSIAKPMDEFSVAGSGSLRKDMELLKMHDPECVLVVKKIKKLGFESPVFLQNHFSQYGGVLDVMVALTHSPQKSKSVRVRPAAMGFVVMGDAAGAKCALEAGTSQDVSGVVIELRPFSSFNDYYNAAE